MNRDIEHELDLVLQRNKAVEGDKAWETSKSRKAIIAVYTYLVVWGWLAAIGVEDAHLHALVPACAFLISTLTLPFAKRVWLTRYFN
ncbi:MAG: hypothetical protein EOM26_04130 [Alphaproteobacteria bacterium]|nr:hypothetical protein [Alphaproteobacteria bacterium]